MLIPREVFELRKFTDTESGRYALDGVLFERQKDKSPVAVATDSKRLVVVEWPEPNNEEYPSMDGVKTSFKKDLSVIVPVDACAKAAKLAKPSARAKGDKPILGYVLMEEDNKNGQVPIHATNLESRDSIYPQALEGKFPNWRESIPEIDKGCKTSKVRLKADYLRDVTDVMRKIVPILTDSGGNYVPVDIQLGNDSESMVLLTAENEGVKVTAVIMPLHKG